MSSTEKTFNDVSYFNSKRRKIERQIEKIFILLGPVVGTLIFSFLNTGFEKKHELLVIPLIFIVYLFPGYLIGYLPAAFTVFLTLRLGRSFRFIRWYFAAVIGAIVCVMSVGLIRILAANRGKETSIFEAAFEGKVFLLLQFAVGFFGTTMVWIFARKHFRHLLALSRLEARKRVF
jgi:hypothetical protein